ncbi:hypothetical protein [Gabonia massiliensis]|uniref:hypothetical protein n=1 Tax=Gabonia massiliensis TaxID=1686296 RepID=UPI0006D83F44|nr:hypothetical protein [Gabonia massiliensis]
MEKILGAHNANTYLKPRKWWMRLINFTSKCQKLTIDEQLEHGVRYLDFRIRYDKELGLFFYCHGLVEYTPSVNQIVLLLSIFAYINETETIYIRFVYDDTFNNNIDDFDLFNLFIEHIYPIIKNNYNIIWELIKKSSWKYIYSNNRPQLSIVDCFKNYRGYKWIPWPRWWAKKNNKRLKKFMDEYQEGTPDKDTVFLFDFVEQST